MPKLYVITITSKKPCRRSHLPQEQKRWPRAQKSLVVVVVTRYFSAPFNVIVIVDISTRPFFFHTFHGPYWYNSIHRRLFFSRTLEARWAEMFSPWPQDWGVSSPDQLGRGVSAVLFWLRIEVYPLLTRIEVYPLLARIEVCSLSSPQSPNVGSGCMLSWTGSRCYVSSPD